MNCREWEDRIAADPDDPAVARHAADCMGCQVFLSGLRETLEMLRAAHADPIAPAHYAAVRARVMAAVGRPRRRWAWAWAAVAAAVAVVTAAGIRERMRVAVLPGIVWRAPDAPAVAFVRQPLPHSRGAVVARHRRPAQIARSEEVIVKLESSDPDVVIYWIAETKGDLPK